eukprot:6169807-Pleurochrysis_carterae.AAC.3
MRCVRASLSPHSQPNDLLSRTLGRGRIAPITPFKLSRKQRLSTLPLRRLKPTHPPPTASRRPLP